MSESDKYYEMMGRLSGMKLPPHIWSFILGLPKKSVVTYFEDCIESGEVLAKYEEIEGV
jgi:hypothetical protein